MKWKKLGLVYCPDGSKWWAKSHAMIPTPVILDESTVRVFMTCCDDNTVGRVGYVDVSSHNPVQILDVCAYPVLDIGEDGTFDENGALVCSVVSMPDGRAFMYYSGFELGTKIRYRLLTGLAIKGATESKFSRVSRTPVLERSDSELFVRGGPFGLLDDGAGIKMWYVAGSNWEQVGDAIKPVYDLYYLESTDGVIWPASGQPCITVEKENEHGFGRPYVVKDGDLYRMFYSIRRRDLQSYRLGYAESLDGITWQRKDDQIGLDVSESGWDSEMICYSAVIELHGKWYMFYNGNDFGRSGFGLAELVSW